jgi:hypothetical protein
MMSAQVETFTLFDCASHVLDQSDLIELVSGATLRSSPMSSTSSRMVTSSPILTTSGSQCFTRPSSPTFDSTFSILGDQVIKKTINKNACKILDALKYLLETDSFRFLNHFRV